MNNKILPLWTAIFICCTFAALWNYNYITAVFLAFFTGMLSTVLLIKTLGKTKHEKR